MKESKQLCLTIFDTHKMKNGGESCVARWLQRCPKTAQESTKFISSVFGRS